MSAIEHSGDASGPLFTTGYRRYVLGLLLIAYILNYLDRIILAMLLPPIKAELDLSDTQVGFLAGLAFALFYATLGLPIARLADRFSRRWIITISISAWSAMTVLCGMAANFVQLVMARFGVAIGEAGCSPSATSLISDYFPRDRRATAFAIYGLGVPLGMLLGMPLGGWLAEVYGWRTTFIVVGAPGILFALLVGLTLREPPRGYSEPEPRKLDYDASFLQVVRELLSSPAYRHAVIAMATGGLGMLCGSIWLPSFLTRSYGVGLMEIGIIMAVINGVARSLGVYLGGVLTDRLVRIDPTWNLRLSGWVTAAAFPINAAAYLVFDLYATLALLTIASALEGFSGGPVMNTCQRLAPLHGRAVSTAFNLFVVSIFSLGIGMQIIGVISDALSASYGDESLRYTLLFVSVVFLWAGLHMLRGSRTYVADLRKVESNPAA